MMDKMARFGFSASSSLISYFILTKNVVKVHFKKCPLQICLVFNRNYYGVDKKKLEWVTNSFYRFWYCTGSKI